MKSLIRTGLAAAAVTAGAIAFAGSAGAAPFQFGFGGGDHAVFVQTDNPSGNQIVAYQRSGNGTLTPAGTYNTGGVGGILAGSAVDHTASQGSLTYDTDNSQLYAVNAGSNTVSVFSVRGDQLSLRQVVSSGGTFPVSVAVHGNLVYVLNAENGGSVQGYFASSGRLSPLPGASRALGLDPTATPQFTNTPGQVAFSPNGSQLIVTTKANGNDIDVFGVGFSGNLSPTPVINSEPGQVPFGVAFDAVGHLVVADTGSNSLATYNLNRNGTVTELDDVGSTQAATCWVAPVGRFFYTSNAGSATVSGYQEAGFFGQLNLLGQTNTDPGTVDASASSDGQFLYVQTGGNGVVDEFQVHFNGSLTEVGSVTVPNSAGGEGIVAS
ncbi:MAG TPA: beta-propeller fold lactonase family protein [Acidimicrobiales bacterium]|jgi:6-phosphogluconolactonase (cycloisomerase 2 family)